MLDLPLAEQTLIFLQAAVLGIGIGILYDIFRIIRVVFHAGFIFTSLADILFSVFTVISVFLFIVITANGIVRFYIPLGLFLGLMLYFFSVSPVVMSVVRHCLHFLGRVFSFLTKKILRSSKKCQ